MKAHVWFIFAAVFLAAAFEAARAGERELPFDAPKRLPDGQFLLFKGADSQAAFAYSDGTEIIVYGYADADAAAADFAAIENSGVLVASDKCKGLSQAGARIFAAGGRSNLAFQMGDSIIAVCYDAKKLSDAQATETGEWVYAKALEQMRKRFETPQATLVTLCEAFGAGNMPLIFSCFAAPVPDDFRRNIAGRVASGQARFFGQESRPSVTATEELDNEAANCRVVEGGTNLWNAPWFRALNEGLPGFQISYFGQSSENVWVPFRRQDNLWKIDLSLIKSKGLARTEEDFKDFVALQECRNNLAQLSFWVQQWLRDRARLPEDPRELLRQTAQYSLLSCPGAAKKSIEKDQYNCSLIYFPYPQELRELPRNALVFCDRAGVHPYPEPQRVVLTLDGGVQVVSENRALEMIFEAERLCKKKSDEKKADEPVKPAEPLTQDEIALIRKLAAQLGSDSYDIREKAQQALIEFGPRAEPALSESLKSDDDEVKWRIGRILKAYHEKK